MGEHQIKSLEIVSRRIMKRLGLGTFAVLVACASAGPGYGQRRLIPTLPECVQTGQTVTLDVSTGTTNGSANPPGTVDPKWQILSAPTGSNVIPPNTYSIPPFSPFWAAPPLSPAATWIEPFPGTTAVSPTSNGTYAYELDFDIPQPLSYYSSISIAGSCRADDAATLSVNTSPTENCGGFNGNTPPVVFSSFPTSVFQPNINKFHADVQNLGGGPTGLMISATVTAVCKELGILKICKAAGPGIAVGTSFNFTAGGGPAFSVPAGPAPGGTCVVGPSFPVGTTVNVIETIPPNDAVSNIAVSPPSNLVTANAATGTAVVTIGGGVTEVTFTDYNKPGYLEICKSGFGSGSFTVNPGGLGPFVVAEGTCSPAIEVSAGTVTIKEAPVSGLVMSGCSTIPAGRQGLCTPSTQTSTVTVVPGGVSTQTIATIHNARVAPNNNPQ